MAEEKPQELLIIKRYRGVHAGHHGGAWKIAFADFMTAMMALFLVLWLISATSEKTKVSIARYFNPVKLVDMSTMKKGVSDPNENISTSPDPQGDGHLKRSESGQRDQQSDAPAKDQPHDPGTATQRQPTHSEQALFRDPYAVLAEIVAAGEAVHGAPRKAAAGKQQPDNADNDSDVAEPFKDPFKIVIPDVLPDQPAAPKKPTSERAQAPSPNSQASAIPPEASARKDPAAQKDAVVGKGAAAQQGAPGQQPGVGKEQAAVSIARKDAAASPPGQQQSAAAAAQGETVKLQAEATKLRAEIATEIAKVTGKPGKPGNDATVPDIEVKANEEGILISLTDQYNYSMFAIGSAEPQPRTIQVMDKIAAILKKYPGDIVIRGHTDARPYKSANYDNWRLSSARAHMAHYMLTRGGLDDRRIVKIESFADRKLKNPKNPMADENRRIEILLRKDRT